VVATAGSDSVTLSGVDSFEPLNVNISDGRSPAITDRAGNVLQPNQLNGDVTYTISLSAGRDYADAPDTYGTTKDSNGAGHSVIEGFHMGAAVDSEPNGMPGPLADGDGADDDGVQFSELIVGYPANMLVTVDGVTDGLTGKIDAWIDWDLDGTWGAGERVAEGVDIHEYMFQDTSVTDRFWCVENPIALGEWNCNIPFDVPGTSDPRSDFITYSRVRLSTQGVSSPHGIVSGGEVEDHVVTVRSNPWQNGNDVYDVNSDSHVTPLDALYVITYLNANVGNSALPLDYGSGAGPGVH
jgi:hypothetical protein